MSPGATLTHNLSSSPDLSIRSRMRTSPLGDFRERERTEPLAPKQWVPLGTSCSASLASPQQRCRQHHLHPAFQSTGPPQGMRLLSSNLDDNLKSRQGCDVPKLKHLQARRVHALPCQGWLQRPPATPLPAQEKAVSRGDALGPDKPPQDGRRVPGWAGGRRAVGRWHLAMSLQDPQPRTLGSPS